ncbi:hypothetical protein HMI55_001755 [Coelomomyces lativittatus]|nr:hypothetical protein HMI56_002105 [Coelomomyces lativittatus]KAJ1505066.1 hypothetical protein HMI55_001755 [Coelomomyces lativittatus]
MFSVEQVVYAIRANYLTLFEKTWFHVPEPEHKAMFERYDGTGANVFHLVAEYARPRMLKTFLSLPSQPLTMYLHRCTLVEKNSVLHLLMMNLHQGSDSDIEVCFQEFMMHLKMDYLFKKNKDGMTPMEVATGRGRSLLQLAINQCQQVDVKDMVSSKEELQDDKDKGEDDDNDDLQKSSV